MTDQEKQFYAIQRYFLTLQKKINKLKTCGQKPPEYLWKHYKDAEREMNYLSEALE